jgi:hypothetical protein
MRFSGPLAGEAPLGPANRPAGAGFRAPKGDARQLPGRVVTRDSCVAWAVLPPSVTLE